MGKYGFIFIEDFSPTLSLRFEMTTLIASSLERAALCLLVKIHGTTMEAH